MTLAAKDIMAKDLTVLRPGTTLPEAVRILIEDGISGAPVVDLGGRLLGIVSKTDLMNRWLEGRMSPALSRSFLSALGVGEDDFPELAMHSDEEELGTVDDFMEPEVVTVAPEAPLAEVARRMVDARIHRVVVVEGERAVGIITSFDLIAHWPGASA